MRDGVARACFAIPRALEVLLSPLVYGHSVYLVLVVLLHVVDRVHSLLVRAKHADRAPRRATRPGAGRRPRGVDRDRAWCAVVLCRWPPSSLRCDRSRTTLRNTLVLTSAVDSSASISAGAATPLPAAGRYEDTDGRFRRHPDALGRPSFEGGEPRPMCPRLQVVVERDGGHEDDCCAGDAPRVHRAEEGESRRTRARRARHRGPQPSRKKI